METKDQFQQIGTLSVGELIYRFPGTDFRMPFETGQAFINNNGVGYVSLAIRDILCQVSGHPKNNVGEFGRKLAKQIYYDPKIRSELKQLLSDKDHSLFYSRTTDGIEILTIPGYPDNELQGYHIDDCEINELIGFNIATYNIDREIPTAERVYEIHKIAIGKRKLIKDRSSLEMEVMQLVPKVNSVYEKCLQLMTDAGFCY